MCVFASADLNLLKHDKPLAATGAAAAAAHLKHLPAYLRDPTLQGKSFVGNSGEKGQQQWGVVTFWFVCV